MHHGRAAVKEKIEIVWKMFGQSPGRDLEKDAREPAVGQARLRGRFSKEDHDEGTPMCVGTGSATKGRQSEACP